MKNSTGATWLTGVCAVAIGSIVAAGQATGAAADQSADLSEVVVTGSRVITNGNDSPTPVTVVPTEQLLAVVPGTISEALNALPQFGGSQNSTSGPGSGVRNAAAAFITLRNAGDNHTLVLYDGHRLLPGSPQESHASDVDLNLIPQMLLKRTDIVTGGAGAVYGSDAISGVVNLITDTNFNGFKANLQGGVSTYHDDPTREAAFAYGQPLFGDRGHFEVSYEYRKDDGVLHWQDKYDRPFIAGIYGGAGAGTAASPYVSLPDALLATSSFGGKIVSATGTIAALNNLNFAQNNALSVFNQGTDGAYYRNSTIKAALDLRKAFARFDYDVTDKTHAYIQYGDSREETKVIGNTPVLSYNVGLNNPFLDGVTVNVPTLTTAQFQALRAANPTASFRMSTMLATQEDQAQPIVADVGYKMLLAGIDGDLGAYRWQLHGGHSESTQTIVGNANIDVGRFLAAVDTVRDASGNIVCRAAATNPNYAGCVPLNPFGPTAAGAAAFNWIARPSVGHTRQQLDEIQASITGAPFNTWAGAVNTALSGEWHKNSYSLSSETTPADVADCAGLRFATLSGAAVTGNCNGPGTTSPTAKWDGNVLNNLPHAQISVYETAVEAQIPLLKDLPWARAVDLNTAARYTNYSSSGVAWTWKAGFVWKINDSLRLRATRSRDIRAPNMFELYAPPQVSIQNYQDFIVNGVGTTQAGSLPLILKSDPNIKPEVANTSTAGFVWQPTAFPGFSVSLDAWRIKMSNTIFQIRAIDSFIRDTCINSNGTSDYCSFFVRATPTSFPTSLVGVNRNIASQDTYGADFESSFSTRLLQHSVDFRLLIAYQPHNIFDTGTGTVLDIGGSYGNLPANVAPSPAIRGTFIVNAAVTDALRIALLEKWRSGMKSTSNVTPGPIAVFSPTEIGGIAYTNLTATYQFKVRNATLEVFGNVQNLFNKFPNPAPVNPTGYLPGRGFNPMPIGDDPIGRYYVAGLRLRM